MNDKKRIMHVLASNAYGGAENVVCQIIHMFRDAPETEMIYCSPDGKIRSSLEERQVPFLPLPGLTPWALARAIRQWKPDIIHAHDMRACFVAALACGRIPLVAHIHNNNFDSRGLTAKAVLFRLAAGKARHIFWVSPSALDSYRFRDAVEAKSSMLRNVINRQQLAQKAEEAELQETYDVVFLGRMSRPKNPLRLIGVLKEIAEKEPEFRAAVIGSGEMDAEVRAAVEATGKEDRIRLLGFQSNAYGILRNAKLMIMTSLWEGTPMCALEAMSLGVPIVSTPVDGLCDLVEPGKTGYLEAEDEDLARRCLQIIRDPELRQRLSRNTEEKAAALLDVERYRRELLRAYGFAEEDRS